MKRAAFAVFSVVCLVLAFFAGGMSGSVPASLATSSPSAAVDPPSQNVSEGGAFSVDIRVDPAGYGVSGGELNFAFDPAAMTADDIVWGDLFGPDPLVGTKQIDNANGTICYALARVGTTTPPTPAGVFATITFTADSIPGTYSLDIANLALCDENFADIPGIVITDGTVTIDGNHAPTQPEVDVTPDTPVTTDDLVCTVVTPSTDPDGDDVVYTYDWYKDGVLQQTTPDTTALTDTLSFSLTAKGETWRCVVTPSDGTDDGPSHQDEVTIQDAALWKVGLDITCGLGTDVAEFGVAPDATEGFDSTYDIPEAPFPPGDYQQAYFYYPDLPSYAQKLSTSYIAPEATLSWPLQVAYNGPDSEVTITWDEGDLAAAPDEYYFFFVASGQWTNMRETPGYAFSASTGTYDFEIIAATALPYAFNLSAGWNTISFPISPLSTDPDDIFGSLSYYLMYRWDPVAGTYVTVGGNAVEPDEPVETGVGYWLLALEDTAVEVVGVPLMGYTTTLSAGWNMIGALFVETSIADPNDDPDGRVLPYAYYWDTGAGTYVLTTTLEPGVGHWVCALDDCILIMEPPPPPSP